MINKRPLINQSRESIIDCAIDVADFSQSFSSFQKALASTYAVSNSVYTRYLIDKAADHLAQDGVPHYLLRQMSMILVDDFTCNEDQVRDAKSLAYKLGISNSKFYRKYYDQYKSVLSRFEEMARDTIDQIKHNLD